ncbi:MAG: HRDC domain-containing protein [Myxococcales bacterium]|nr:HRDC domain-containing protein [Myxococcales bacterium]MCB9643839.1 HRDC domain-containing protein [Myxococcales bacterium]
MWRWIDRDDTFEAWWKLVKDEADFAVDTESNSVHSYRTRLCLMQIATRSEIALLDLLALGPSSIEKLGVMLSDPSRLKVLHSASNDLLGLQRDYQIYLRGLFDTEIAAAFLSLPMRGLGGLLKEFFGVEMSKKFQMLDWSRRPLPQDALAYAAMDVQHLLELRDILLERLEDAGWLDAVLEESTAMAVNTDYQEKPFDPAGYRKIKGARDLPTKPLRALCALYQVRHEICEREDRAAFLVLPDNALMGIARHLPRNMQELSDVEGLHARQIRHYGSLILEAVERSWSLRRLPHEEKKHRHPRGEGGVGVSSEMFDGLRSWRAELAEREGIEGSLLFSNQLLKNCLSHAPRDLVSLAKVPGMSGWRVRRYGRELLPMLAP